jgi:hypothetical protein
VGLRSFGFLASCGFVGSLSFWAGLVATCILPVYLGAPLCFFNKFIAYQKKSSRDFFVKKIFSTYPKC